MPKLKEAETKARDFAASNQNLQASLDDALYSKKNLEDEVFVLKNELVDTSDIYF